MTDLVVDWCSYEAAKYAVEHWHYSKCMPAGKTVKLGAWEDSEFIGCVIFSRGANNNIGKTYELTQTECCELTRIALTDHKSNVSEIGSKAIKMLKDNSPNLRLIISYADPREGHNGGVYQAMNWIYVGKPPQSKGAHYVIYIGDVRKEMHGRSVRSKWGSDKNIPYEWEYLTGREKHKYLYPLDKAMRRQILPLTQPYPKSCGQSGSGDTPDSQSGDAGSIPAVRFNMTGGEPVLVEK